MNQFEEQQQWTNRIQDRCLTATWLLKKAICLFLTIAICTSPQHFAEESPKLLGFYEHNPKRSEGGSQQILRMNLPWSLKVE